MIILLVLLLLSPVCPIPYYRSSSMNISQPLISLHPPYILTSNSIAKLINFTTLDYNLTFPIPLTSTFFASHIYYTLNTSQVYHYERTSKRIPNLAALQSGMAINLQYAYIPMRSVNTSITVIELGSYNRFNKQIAQGGHLQSGTILLMDNILLSTSEAIYVLKELPDSFTILYKYNLTTPIYTPYTLTSYHNTLLLPSSPYYQCLRLTNSIITPVSSIYTVSSSLTLVSDRYASSYNGQSIILWDYSIPNPLIQSKSYLSGVSKGVSNDQSLILVSGGAIHSISNNQVITVAVIGQLESTPIIKGIFLNNNILFILTANYLLHRYVISTGQLITLPIDNIASFCLVIDLSIVMILRNKGTTTQSDPPFELLFMDATQLLITNRANVQGSMNLDINCPKEGNVHIKLNIFPTSIAAYIMVSFNPYVSSIIGTLMGNITVGNKFIVNRTPNSLDVYNFNLQKIKSIPNSQSDSFILLSEDIIIIQNAAYSQFYTIGKSFIGAIERQYVGIKTNTLFLGKRMLLYTYQGKPAIYDLNKLQITAYIPAYITANQPIFFSQNGQQYMAGVSDSGDKCSVVLFKYSRSNLNVSSSSYPLRSCEKLKLKFTGVLVVSNIIRETTTLLMLQVVVDILRPISITSGDNILDFTSNNDYLTILSSPNYTNQTFTILRLTGQPIFLPSRTIKAVSMVSVAMLSDPFTLELYKESTWQMIGRIITKVQIAAVSLHPTQLITAILSKDGVINIFSNSTTVTLSPSEVSNIILLEGDMLVLLSNTKLSIINYILKTEIYSSMISSATIPYTHSSPFFIFSPNTSTILNYNYFTNQLTILHPHLPIISLYQLNTSLYCLSSTTIDTYLQQNCPASRYNNEGECVCPLGAVEVEGTCVCWDQTYLSGNKCNDCGVLCASCDEDGCITYNGALLGALIIAALVSAASITYGLWRFLKKRKHTQEGLLRKNNENGENDENEEDQEDGENQHNGENEHNEENE